MTIKRSAVSGKKIGVWLLLFGLLYLGVFVAVIYFFFPTQMANPTMPVPLIPSIGFIAVAWGILELLYPE